MYLKHMIAIEAKEKPQLHLELQLTAVFVLTKLMNLGKVLTGPDCNPN